MNYIAYFNSIDEIKYRVNIITDPKSSEVKELILAGESPVTVNYPSADKLFNPMRTSTCTVRLVVDDYPLDIYTGKADGTEVVVERYNGAGWDIEWMGFVQPNVYNQSYNGPVEDLEIVASDYLSVLQYFDYKTANPTKQDIVTFFDILKGVCDRFPRLKGFYYSLSTFYDDTIQKEKALRPEDIFISERNFFSSEDEPWKMKNVLEEMMKILGFTIYQDKEHLIITDFSCRKNASETMQYYPKDKGYSGWVTSIGSSKTIREDSYRMTGADMSLDDVYNKVTVKDVNYNVNNLLPDLFDKKKLRNLNGADDAVFTRKAFLYADRTDPDGPQQGDCYYKFFDNSSWTQHCYIHQKLEGKFNEIFVPDNYRGDTTSMREYISPAIVDYAFKTYYKDEKLDFKKYLVLCARNTPTILGVGSVEESEFVPLIDTTEISPMIYGDNTVLLLSATVQFTFFVGRPYLNTDPKIVKKEIKEPKWAEDIRGWVGKYEDVKLDYINTQPYMVFELRINNKWWNGTGWQDQRCHFKVKTGKLQPSSYFFTDVNLQNNVKGSTFIGDIGYRIDLPPLTHTATDIYFGICQCQPLVRVKNGPMTDYGEGGNAEAWVSNVAFKVVREGQQLWSNDDVIYDNVIDEGNVIDGPKIDCKITSDAGKTFSYSTLGFDDYYGKVQPLVRVKKKDYFKSQRPEENIVEAYVTQYSTPSIVENLTLNLDYGMSDTITDSYWNKDFLVLGTDKDFQYGRQTITLIEKKDIKA